MVKGGFFMSTISLIPRPGAFSVASSSSDGVSSGLSAQGEGSDVSSSMVCSVQMTEIDSPEPFSNPDFVVMPDGSHRRDFVVLENGSVYVGELKNGKPHGAGLLKPYFKSRYYDAGTFLNGKIWTGGRYFDPNVPKDHSNEKIDWLVLSDGKVYVGELREGKPEGNGILKPSEQDVYRQEGNFKNGELWEGKTYIPPSAYTTSKAVGGYVYTKNGEVQASSGDCCSCVIL